MIERLPGVLADLARIGPADQAARCRLLESAALKDKGYFAEALSRLDDLCDDPRVMSDSLLRSVTLTIKAETLAKLGRQDEAIVHLRDAHVEVLNADTPWALAQIHAIFAEVQRDQGNLNEAIESYRIAIGIYADAGMEVFVAYLRIILAETLMASGKNDEALVEIVAALPAIEREHLVRDAIVAGSLLRELALRSAGDQYALRRLGAYLETYGRTRPH